MREPISIGLGYAYDLHGGLPSQSIALVRKTYFNRIDLHRCSGGVTGERDSQAFTTPQKNESVCFHSDSEYLLRTKSSSRYSCSKSQMAMACASHVGLLPAITCQMLFFLRNVRSVEGTPIEDSSIHMYIDMHVCRLIDRMNREIRITSSSWNIMRI
jgi:hypothetical protein